MNSIELILVGGILLLQVYVFLSSLRNIQRFRNIFPSVGTVHPKEAVVGATTFEQLQNEGAEFALSVLLNDEMPPDEEDIKNSSYVRLTLLAADRAALSTEFNSILLDINTYLVRNKGAAADFSLISDIVERHVDAEENNLQQQVSVPLYLGLIGTLIGVVTGLFNLWMNTQTLVQSEVSADGGFGIGSFLIAVAIAMMASLMGVLLSVINGNFIFKTAKHALERKKIAFYNLVQKELMPVLNHDVAAGLNTLQKRLDTFSYNFTLRLDQFAERFGKQVKELGANTSRNHESLLAQREVLEKLDKLRMLEFANANIKILQQLDLSVVQLSKFNAYLENLQSLAVSSQELAGSFRAILAGTDHFKHIAHRLEQGVEQNEKLAMYLLSHNQVLDDRRTFISNFTETIDSQFDKSFRLLAESISQRIQSFNNSAAEQEHAMKKSLEVNSGNLAKLTQLDQLTILVKLQQDSQERLDHIERQLLQTNLQLEISNQRLEKIVNKGFWAGVKRRWTTIQKRL